MRRLFIIRKDLHLSSGKLAAMVGHCCEAYWTNLLKQDYKFHKDHKGLILEPELENIVSFQIAMPKDIWIEYVNGIFTKTICEAKNLNQLSKVDEYIAEVNSEFDDEHKLVQKVDYGWINDKCLTELTPENEDGTTTIGIWFRPLPDDVAHKISKKFKLYRDETKKETNFEHYKTKEAAEQAYDKHVEPLWNTHEGVSAGRFISWLYKEYNEEQENNCVTSKCIRER